MYSRGLCLGFFVIDRRKRLLDPIGISRLIGQTARLYQRHRRRPMLPARTRPLEFNARKKRASGQHRIPEMHRRCPSDYSQASLRRRANRYAHRRYRDNEAILHRGTSRERNLRRPFWAIARWQLSTLEANTAANMTQALHAISGWRCAGGQRRREHDARPFAQSRARFSKHYAMRVPGFRELRHAHSRCSTRRRLFWIPW